MVAELAEMDRRVLVRALNILQDKGKATIFGLDDEEDEVSHPSSAIYLLAVLPLAEH